MGPLTTGYIEVMGLQTTELAACIDHGEEKFPMTGQSSIVFSMSSLHRSKWEALPWST